jgi:hypothetical protein
LGDVPIRIWTLSGYRLDWKEANFLSLTPGANALKQRPKVIPARNVRVRTDEKLIFQDIAPRSSSKNRILKYFIPSQPAIMLQ